MIDAMLAYLRRSGWTPPAVDAVRPRLPRWETRLRERGVEAILFWGGAGGDPIGDLARAHNELNLIMLQARPDRGGELGHHLRNLTGVRPFKP